MLFRSLLLWEIIPEEKLMLKYLLELAITNKSVELRRGNVTNRAFHEELLFE
jgi:hypothetical protein